MADRPFAPGKRNYIDLLNDLYMGTGLPRIRVDPADPESEGTQLTVNRNLVFLDNGYVADVLNSLTLYPLAETRQDGWSIFVNVRAGTATINVGQAGGVFQDATPSKTITAGNGAIISYDGESAYRIFRFATN